MLLNITSNGRTENTEIGTTTFKMEASEILYECDIRNDKGEDEMPI